MGTLENKLYILHGWTKDTSRWNPFLEELKKQKITPVFLSIPGLSAPIDHPWTLDDYVKWLYQQLQSESKISLLGHSNGGRIALAFAHKYPDEIGQLFLVDSAGIYHNDFLTKSRRNIFKVISHVGKTLTKSETARNMLYKLLQESDYRDATPVMRETMKNLISVDLLPILAEIYIPTIIIWGENDQVTPYTDALILKQGIPEAQLFSIKNARHSPQFTHISEVVSIIKKNIL